MLSLRERKYENVNIESLSLSYQEIYPGLTQKRKASLRLQANLLYSGDPHFQAEPKPNWLSKFSGAATMTPGFFLFELSMIDLPLSIFVYFGFVYSHLSPFLHMFFWPGSFIRCASISRWALRNWLTDSLTHSPIHGFSNHLICPFYLVWASTIQSLIHSFIHSNILWDGMGSIDCGYWCRHRSKDYSLAHLLPLQHP